MQDINFSRVFEDLNARLLRCCSTDSKAYHAINDQATNNRAVQEDLQVIFLIA